MRHLKWLFTIMLLVVAIPAVIAQACEAIVDELLEQSSSQDLPITLRYE